MSILEELETSFIDFGKEWSDDEETGVSNSRAGAPFDPRIANNLMKDVGHNLDIAKL